MDSKSHHNRVKMSEAEGKAEPRGFKEDMF